MATHPLVRLGAEGAVATPHPFRATVRFVSTPRNVRTSVHLNER